MDKNERRLARSVGFGLLIGAALGPARAAQTVTPSDARMELALARLPDPTPLFVDVRPTWQFAAKHIKDAINVPVITMETASLPRHRTLILYCSAHGCSLSEQAAVILGRRGYTKLEVLEGGIEAWQTAGYEIVSDAKMQERSDRIMLDSSPVGTAALDEIKDGVLNGLVFVLDTRTPYEFSGSHLPHAVNIPLETLDSNLCAFAAGQEIVVYDRLSARAVKAAKRLRAAHLTARVLEGGLSLWASKGYALTAASEAPVLSCKK